ncbi:MAG: hypothetical protein K2M48_06240, partial [Clostridiales bacterium]|nr:hypothetical protein [Clostridiales bacterium]
LEDMGLKPISSHHERGPGQNEIDFESADPLSAARNFIMFKSAVKNVCAINGAHASFQPRPMPDQPGSGLHLSITLSGKNKEKATKAFAEGVLRRCKEITCFANPTLNSYSRIMSRKVAYDSVRGLAMRIFGENNNIIQLRTPDSSCNIFAVLALIFAAGREGIEGKYELREAGAGDDRIFDSITEAVAFARKSKWLHENVPEQLDNILDSVLSHANAAQKLKSDLELFKYYSDI